MNSSVQTVALCPVSHWMTVSEAAHTRLSKTMNESISLPWALLLYSDDSDGTNQRPRSRSMQGSPQLSPIRSLGAEFDVETQGSPRENHHNKNHSRCGSRLLTSNLTECSHKVLFDELVLQLLILLRGGLDGDSVMCWQNLQYLPCHVCSLIQFLTSSLLFFFFNPLLKPHPFRLAFESPDASHFYQNPREVSSTHSSPYKTLPRPPRDPRSMPPTPVMTRNAYSSSQLRCAPLHCPHDTLPSP